MQVMVVGLGSMGRRRIRLLQKYDKSFSIIGVDSQTSRRRQAEDEFNIITESAVENVFEKYIVDAVFVSASPLSHAEIIKMSLENNAHVFSELNLTDTMYDENIYISQKKNKVLFLSSTLLYRREVQYIQKQVRECEGDLSYVYHVGQYLPDWHPWENYKNFFAAGKRTNGCREFLSIELPWLIETFGEIVMHRSAGGKLSTLELNYPDSYFIFIEHASGCRGVLLVDVVSRKAVRNFELFGELLYLTWDGTPDGLVKYDYFNKCDEQIRLYDVVDKRDDYCESIIEDAYYDEICNFMGVIAGIDNAKYSFEKDKKTLALINELEFVNQETI